MALYIRRCPAPPKIIGSPTPTSSYMPKAKTEAVPDDPSPAGKLPSWHWRSWKHWPWPWSLANCLRGDDESAIAAPLSLLEFCRQQFDTVEAQIRALDEGQIKPWSRTEWARTVESQILTTSPRFCHRLPLDLHVLDGGAAGAQVEQALSQWVGVNAPANLGDAMRYAVLDGGKRLRPLLVLAAAPGCARAA